MGFTLKDSYKPFHCPCPKWRPAESRVLYDYYSKKLESGEFFHNPGATWASRPHIALKPISGEPKRGGIFDIRPCGDYSQVNTRFKKSVPNYPCTQAEIERAAGHLLYAVTDAHSQFQSVRVKEGIDQECMTLWAPKIGKITPRTLQFGHLDASTLAQGIYRGFYQTARLGARHPRQPLVLPGRLLRLRRYGGRGDHGYNLGGALRALGRLRQDVRGAQHHALASQDEAWLHQGHLLRPRSRQGRPPADGAQP